MNKKTKNEMLSALAGGAIIKALPDTKDKPWVDFRGNVWSNAEIKEMKKLKIAQDVAVVNISSNGVKELNKIGGAK